MGGMALNKNLNRKIIVVITLFFSFLCLNENILADKHLTIERLFSDPRLEGITPREIKWAEDNAKFAFLWNSKGEKNLSLWIYDLKSKKLNEVVSEEDFVEPTEISKEEEERKTIMRKATTGITDFIWSPNSKKLLIPYHSDLFIYDLQLKILSRITKTDKAELDPKFCGSSDKIVYMIDNDLWLQDIKENQTIQLTKTGSKKILNGLSNYIALEELQRYSSYECSADGKAIAYIQSDISPIRELIVPDYLPRFVDVRHQARPLAGGKNALEKIGIVPAKGGETTWVNIPCEEFYVLSIKWYDNQLLLRILERNNKILHLYIFDRGSHSLKELLQEEDEKWVNIANNFMSPVNDSQGILWTSERNGFNHLYFFDLEKDRLKPLTHGNWEITQLHGMDKNKTIYFTATTVEPQQRHLFSQGFKSGRMERLTKKEGWHQITFSPDYNYYIDLFSDHQSPPQFSLSNLKKPEQDIKIIDTLNPELSKYELSEIEFLNIKSRDDEEIYCKVFKPDDLKEKKRYPAIIYVHGGGYAQSVRKQWRGIAHLFHHYLAQELKYIVVDVDYRGSSGYGREYRTDVHLTLGKKDLEDVVDAIEYLKKLSYIDSENLGIWGWSYGGFLTNMAMLKTPDIFKAGAAVAPVNDWKNYDTQYTEERLSTPQEAPEAYENSSPITYAQNLKNHLLIIHGMGDDNVHFQDTVQLINKFIENKIDFDLMIYPEGKHGISKDTNRIHLFKKIVQHFERYLK